jgi:uncharacterized membrane protein YkvA (DUF1232 family)
MPAMTDAPTTPSTKVTATPVAPAPVATRDGHRKATLFTVLTSPRAWWRFFRDKDAPKFPKFVAVLALLYVISPVDAVPDIAPIIGWLDDLGLSTVAAAWLASVAAKYANEHPQLSAADATPPAPTDPPAGPSAPPA